MSGGAGFWRASRAKKAGNNDCMATWGWPVRERVGAVPPAELITFDGRGFTGYTEWWAALDAWWTAARGGRPASRGGSAGGDCVG